MQAGMPKRGRNSKLLGRLVGYLVRQKLIAWGTQLMAISLIFHGSIMKNAKNSIICIKKLHVFFFHENVRGLICPKFKNLVFILLIAISISLQAFNPDKMFV